jgi:phospholipid/cholesterol/gamma-HCH transport system substrate-binding protein
MASPARLAGVGVFVIGTLLLFGTALFLIADRQMAFADRVVIYTEFSKITGLQPGALVRVSGARAGSVQDIEVPATPAAKFRVRMEVVEELLRLVRTDSLASIETEGLVGGSYLAISSGSPEAPQAPPLSTIAGQEPFDVGDLLDQMSTTIVKVNMTIDALRGELDKTMVAIGDTVGNANDLITTVSDDVRAMAKSGARVSGDLAALTNDVREGRGTVGRLFHDDELYARIARTSGNVEEVTKEARALVANARQAIEAFNGQNGQVAGLTSDLRQTIDHANEAMERFSDNMDAMRHNFLFRGFFNRRGYYDLEDISPAAYRAGALARDNKRHAVRVWLENGRVFDTASPSDGPQLTAEGRGRLDAALAPYLDRAADAVLMIEGYAQGGEEDERYLRSRARAAAVRAYLVDRFHLDPQTAGVMPLGSESPGSPAGQPWDGVALAIFLPTP